MHQAWQLHRPRRLRSTGTAVAGHAGVTNQPAGPWHPGSGGGMLAREEKRTSGDQNETTLKRVIYGLIQGCSTLPRKGSPEGAADGRCLPGTGAAATELAKN